MYIGIPNIIHEYPHKTTISNGCAMSASFNPQTLSDLGFHATRHALEVEQHGRTLRCSREAAHSVRE